MEPENISDIRRTMKFKCPFLVILILSSIGAVLAIGLSLVAFFGLQGLLESLKVTEKEKIDSNQLQFILQIIIFITVTETGITYLGWRGYNNLTYAPTFVFATSHAIKTTGSLISAITMFTIAGIIQFILSLIITTFCFLFAFEVEKVRKEIEVKKLTTRYVVNKV